jgi:hypothetical protein
MRTDRPTRNTPLRMSAVLTLGLALAALAQDTRPATDFPYTLPFQVGDIEFAPGDSIVVERVTGTSATVLTGQVYCVEGTYTLGSRDEAMLSISATTVQNVSTPVEPGQTIHVQKGSGTFRLVKTMWVEGYLHASFNDWPQGSAFGGVYFGQDPYVLRHKGWSWLEPAKESHDASSAGAAAETPVSNAGPNRVLFEYLGNPVEPPAALDPAYTREGLINAIHEAAQKAGITVKRVEVEDSEFPFLVGTICKEGDFEKLTAQLRTLPGYAYNGCTSSSTHAAFNIVPYQAYPPGTSTRIYHRYGLRCSAFLDRLQALR